MSTELGARAGTLASAFSLIAAERPDALALTFGRCRLTYGDLDRSARRLAGGLRRRGIAPGDRVLVVARNRPEHVNWMLATTRLGAIHAAVHPSWTAVELARVIRDAQPRLVATERNLMPTVAAALDDAGGAQLVDLDDVGERRALEASPSGDMVRDDASPDDDCALWYTSGTSGKPKGVVWTHNAFLFNALAINHALDIGQGDIGLRVSPISHNGVSSAVVGTMLRGAPVHLMARFDATEVAHLIRDEGITWTNLVPAAAQLLLNAARAEGIATLPSLRRVLVGAAPTPPALLERLSRFLPHSAIVHGYGATEGYISVCRADVPSRTDGSVGPPLPGVDVRILDDDGHALPPCRAGRIVFKSPGTMRCYWRNPEATASVISADGWLDIGDLGHQDEHGGLWVIGRRTDVINTGGYNVYASEVENALDRLPGVEAAAVIGVADEIMSERVVAFVEPSAGSAPDVDSLMAGCAATLAGYKRPKHIELMDALPRNSYGKIDKRALKEAWNG